MGMEKTLSIGDLIIKKRFYAENAFDVGYILKRQVAFDTHLNDKCCSPSEKEHEVIIQWIGIKRTSFQRLFGSIFNRFKSFNTPTNFYQSLLFMC